MTLKIGVVGAGWVAGRHLEVLQKLGGISLVGISNRTYARAEELARKHGTRAFQDWTELLDKGKPDALFICVTPNCHGELERAAVEQKIPFLVEKPLGIDWRV